MTEASAEGKDPGFFPMTTEASIEEAEDTTRLSERVQRRRRQCFFTVRPSLDDDHRGVN